MKMLLVPVQLALALCLAAQGPATPPAAIAVSACSVSGFEPPSAYQSLVIDAFTAELSRFPAVTTLDRRSMDARLKEIELSLSGLVDSNSAIDCGALIGAAWILSASLTNFGGTSTLLSAQLINTTTGEVAYAASEIIDGVALASIQDRVKSVARALVARLEPGAAATVTSLWVTDAPATTSTATKPILIWVMSNAADATDANGVWYLGPAQLKPLTDRLKAAGHGVVVQDRRTLAHLTDISLADYSQLWIIEGDGDARVDVRPAEATALKAYYDTGGRVWLSGENAMEPAASWVEDINALARPFGAYIGGILITPEPGFATRGLQGPLFAGIDKLVYDDEIGIISFSDRSVSMLLEAPPEARMVAGSWTQDSVSRWALPERVRELATHPAYGYGWLFGSNFAKIGSPAGRGKAVMAMRDERVRGKGMLLIDSGWLIGWAFNGPQNRILDVGQNVEFILNAAAFLGAK